MQHTDLPLGLLLIEEERRYCFKKAFKLKSRYKKLHYEIEEIKKNKAVREESFHKPFKVHSRGKGFFLLAGFFFSFFSFFFF